jgi:hypothetical protein
MNANAESDNGHLFFIIIITSVSLRTPVSPVFLVTLPVK